MFDNSYKKRLEGILKAGWDMTYGLYVLIVYKMHTKETEVHFVDKTYGLFPDKETYSDLLSRSQDIVPHIISKINACRKP